MKRLVSLLVSASILAAIYLKIDFTQMLEVFKQTHIGWLIAGLAMVIPTTGFTAWRLKTIAPKAAGLELGEATKLILAASVLNMVLPSKMGDIAKAYFIGQREGLTKGLALSLVIFEKACDMLSLLLWCGLGLLLYPQKDALFWTMTVTIVSGLAAGLLMLWSLRFSDLFFGIIRRISPRKVSDKIIKLQDSWQTMHAYFWRDKMQLTTITVTSVFIWFLHLLQIWMFILALNQQQVPLITSLGLTPLAILAGLLPLTFAGVGTRDAALIFFYGSYFNPAIGAALGVLCTLRYVMPALGGLPFFARYLP
jgi:uncharacterized protein (TIRG00374 family)